MREQNIRHSCFAVIRKTENQFTESDKLNVENPPWFCKFETIITSNGIQTSVCSNFYKNLLHELPDI